MMSNLFDVIPSGFFNCLANSSNNVLYAGCLQVIYEQYDREVCYQIKRNIIRDTIALYLVENHFDLSEDESQRSPSDRASDILRRFCEKEIGWLEEDLDESTYEKNIVMTEQGIRLAEFILILKKPEKEEYSSYIYNIYNTMTNPNQWQEDPYVWALKNVYKNAKSLANALKKLSTFIKKIIEKMIKEESLETLTENILSYLEGDFIKEYSRLVKQQNIHLYRRAIKGKLNQFQTEPETYELLIIGCACEEELDEHDAEELVINMIQATKRFLTDDYDRILQDIKHKINIYLQVAVGRARFIKNHEVDDRGNIEQTISYISDELDTFTLKDDLPENMRNLFHLQSNEYIDINSLRYPRTQQSIKKEVISKIERMTEEDIEKTKRIHEREANNPYSKARAKQFVGQFIGKSKSINVEDIPIKSKRDLLITMSAVAYGEENGYKIELLDGYVEYENMTVKRFRFIEEE